MKHNSCPFFAGQKTGKGLSEAQVLAPLPVQTRMAPEKNNDAIFSQNEHTLEIGISAKRGIVFQTQYIFVWVWGGILITLGTYIFLEEFQGLSLLLLMGIGLMINGLNVLVTVICLDMFQ